MLKIYFGKIRFEEIVLWTCIANKGDTQGYDGVHEHPQLQLFVSVASEPLKDFVFIKERF